MIAELITAAVLICGETDRTVVAANGEAFCAPRYSQGLQSPGDGSTGAGDSGASSGASSGGSGGGSGNGCSR